MPVVDFAALPADARVWVFAADASLTESGTRALIHAVDEFLSKWNAHGHPLRSARALRDNRFLAIGVDQSTAGASGCSIDGLFRALQLAENAIGARLLPGGRVYWRTTAGDIRSAERGDFSRRAKGGEISDATPVFDTTVTTAAEWRDAFERPARETWHATLLR
ncbi:MAG TPA: hypothetical protein VE967_08075 [Gemmatimonadaceae bacterium]|nr:hypothetical protein [Gemmatimonadaceae bacterium]